MHKASRSADPPVAYHRRSALIIWVMLCICCSGASMASSTDPMHKARASAVQDARLCLHPSADVLAQLRQGTRRLQVSVHAYTPPQPATGTVVLWLLAGKQRHEITRFAVHPMQAFTAKQPERSQHFDVALDAQAALLAGEQPVCFALGFDRKAAKYTGGLLEVSLH